MTPWFQCQHWLCGVTFTCKNLKLYRFKYMNWFGSTKTSLQSGCYFSTDFLGTQLGQFHISCENAVIAGKCPLFSGHGRKRHFPQEYGWLLQKKSSCAVLKIQTIPLISETNVCQKYFLTGLNFLLFVIVNNFLWQEMISYGRQIFFIRHSFCWQKISFFVRKSLPLSGQHINSSNSKSIPLTGNYFFRQEMIPSDGK